MSNPRWRPSNKTRPSLSDNRRLNHSHETKKDGANVLSKQKVYEFLQGNQQTLDDYVDSLVSQETIERWLVRKKEKVRGGGKHIGQAAAAVPRGKIKPSQVSSEKPTIATCNRTTKELLQSLLPLAMDSDKVQLLLKATSLMATALKADSCQLYCVRSSGDSSQKNVLLPINDSSGNCEREELNITEGDTIAGYVASTGLPVITNSNERDFRFPNGSGLNVSTSTAFSLLAAPIIKYDGSPVVVVELSRRITGSKASAQFSDEDFTIFLDYMKWTSMMFEMKCPINKAMDSALLEIFSDTIGLEQILQAISEQAVNLLNADKSSVFLVDKPRGELYAQVFGMPVKEMEYIEKIKELSVEVHVNEEDGGTRPYAFKHSTEGLLYKGNPIRFPVSHGIAGHVAKSGEIVLCKDVAKDERFNSQVDLETGYETKTILCGPLKTKTNISGVVELINKTDGQSFTKNDQELFSQYIEHCSKIYDTAKAFLDAKYSEQQYKVAIEMLAYHRQSTEAEVEQIKTANQLATEREQELLCPDMDTLRLNDLEHIQATFYMFSELACKANISHLFDSDVVLRFILTVSKNYRPVPYHGWYHGFWVAQCMYAIVSSKPEVFNGLEMLALFTASLCHDLDHRGFTNNFFEKNNAPLAALYSTSIMENHHFDQTLAILQTPGVDLFSAFDANCYKQILHCMEHAILSTDMGNMLKTRTQFNDLIDNGTFDWTNHSHKMIGHGMLIVGCDICAVAKPWSMHRTAVDWLMREFYKQGDKEKEIGLTPLQLMDKDYEHKLPSFQIGFMQAITFPCYTLLSGLFPVSMKSLLQGVENNMKVWLSMMENDNGIDCRTKTS